MTITTNPPVAVSAVQPTISTDIRARLEKIIAQQNGLLKEREEVIRGSWVARVAQQHVLMHGPGGTGKSLFARNLSEHIEDAKHFEVAVDETTDPSQVFGPPDIKAMVADGKTRRIPTGMLPEATDAFIDEFFNANGPLLHSIMPALNERIFHNNGMPSDIPLRQCIAGTNKLNSDADQAALWDRIHIRFSVDYVRGREAQMDMIGHAILRSAELGRSGTGTRLGASEHTTVTLAELDQAREESLTLVIPDQTFETFLDLREELEHGEAKIAISDRRAVEGMFAVLANSWLRGHTEVQVADLDILANMWWTLLDQATVARSTILGVTNPGEKAAFELLKDLEGLIKEVRDAEKSDLDERRKKNAAVQAVTNVNALAKEAQQHLDNAVAAGTSTTRLEDVIRKADAFKIEVGQKVFGIDPTKASV